jgi:L-asparaginase / beta-aspartyl-peptidase
MVRSRNRIALVAHGGAGAIGPSAERPERRRGMMAAIQHGAKILRADGSALEAVVATVVALEDHPLFNAGYGSLLNSEGNVEMDASVMVAEPVSAEGASRGKRSARTDLDRSDYSVSAGAVAAVSRVRNPIALARAVMEHSPHILMAGPGAESFARKVGVKLVRPEEMVTERARERWRVRMEQAGALQAEAAARAAMGHGTVGAVAVDRSGAIAAATSTGGVPGKLYGRVGDSALIGAGTFAHAFGAASATGQGEAIIMTALCREAVLGLVDGSPQAVAREAIDEMIEATGAEAGIIIIDRRGRIGCAHNAASMQVARYDTAGGTQHLWLKPIATARRQ